MHAVSQTLSKSYFHVPPTLTALVRAQGGKAVEAGKRFVPGTCNNTDVVVDWTGGRHDTLHAPFGLRANIDPAVYKVIIKKRS